MNYTFMKKQEPNIEYLTYQELKLKLADQKPTYQQLLHTIEWRKLRDVVLERDNHKCTVCSTTASSKHGKKHIKDLTKEEIELEKFLANVKNDYYTDENEFNLQPATKVGEFINKPLHLHIHHTFYIITNLPWEYDIEDLVTMCEPCHFDYHKKNRVNYFKDLSKSEIINLTPCTKCNASGHLAEYSHWQGGICFKCMGAKYIEFIGKGLF